MDAFDPALDGSYELPDIVAILKVRLEEAHDREAIAVAQHRHAQRTVDELRARCNDLQAALVALEQPAEKEPEAGHAAG